MAPRTMYRSSRRLAAMGCALAAVATTALGQAPANDSPAAPSGQAPRVDLDKLKRPANPAAPSNLFGSRSWEKRAPERRVAPPPPPPPQAPPLPYTYVGRWIERGETFVMLSGGGRNVVVRPGEKLDGAYQLERIDNDKLVIRYLPLDQVQVLPFSGGPPALAQPGRNEQEAPQRRRTAPRDADDEED